MVYWLHISFPILLILWFTLHFITNERAARRNPHYHSTRIRLDDNIPFIPVFIFPYYSGYILAISGFFLLNSNDMLPKVSLGYIILFIVGILSYTLYPCRVDRCEDIEVKTISTFLLSSFHRTTKPFNSFPSMHVSYSMYSALMVLCWENTSVGIALLVWAILVAASTLLTKLHHTLDVIAGVILAIVTSLVLYCSLFQT